MWATPGYGDGMTGIKVAQKQDRADNEGQVILAHHPCFIYLASFNDSAAADLRPGCLFSYHLVMTLTCFLVMMNDGATRKYDRDG